MMLHFTWGINLVSSLHLQCCLSEAAFQQCFWCIWLLMVGSKRQVLLQVEVIIIMNRLLLFWKVKEADTFFFFFNIKQTTFLISTCHLPQATAIANIIIIMTKIFWFFPFLFLSLVFESMCLINFFNHNINVTRQIKPFFRQNHTLHET